MKRSFRIKLEETSTEVVKLTEYGQCGKDGVSMQKRITKNLTLKILAFLIAVFLWLIVVNIDDPVDR